MLNSDTDKEWEEFGKSEPYFGVITCDKYLKSNLTNENREEFINSGYVYINNVLNNIRKHIDPNFKIKQALDFGCGVGRLTIPLAEVAELVTGIDVSESMLNEAMKNCKIRDVRNVKLIKSDDKLSLLDYKYNFIHSFIVFQHIPTKRGEQIFKNLLTRLTDDGICVLHFTYAKDYKSVKKFVKKLTPFIKNYIPFAKNIINLINRNSFFAPQMQMNSYDLNNLFYIMQKSGVCDSYIEFTNHYNELGIVLYLRRHNKTLESMRGTGHFFGDAEV